MIKVNKCSFCDKISQSEEEIRKHELICGHNPKNEINDEMLIKISKLKYDYEDALTYVLLNDYYDKLEFFRKELDRASVTNCPVYVLENVKFLKSIINRVFRLEEEKEIKWFNSLCEKGVNKFIEAIRSNLC